MTTTPALVPSFDLITKYSKAGPRYTSYPPVPYWPANYTQADYDKALAEMGDRIRAFPPSQSEGPGVGSLDVSSLNPTTEPQASLYIHIPFCEHRCTFCACNVIISRAHNRGRPYVATLTREMDRALRSIAQHRPKIRQIHWGGGTPTWLSADELAELQDAIADRFELTEGREQSIEIDPRVTTRDQLAALRERGLNRVSLGVQDLNPDVQDAINRIQPLEVTAEVIAHARSLGIPGVNVDLVYGLPHQTIDGFASTIDTVLALNIDRVALYNFAYLPDRLTHHKAIRPEWLPSAQTRVELFRTAVERFTSNGYVMIGLDHFAKSTDELARAQADRTIQRNFMGYTTRAGSDLLAFGVSSISRVGRDFVQNIKTTAEYEEAVQAGNLPVEQGMHLSDDDLLRESIIQSLMCHARVDFSGTGVPPVFPDLLAHETTRRQLDDLAADNLITWNDRSLEVTPLGRYFLRNIAMVFDAYLQRGQPITARHPSTQRPVQIKFSKTI